MLVLIGKDSSEASSRFRSIGFAAVRLRALAVSINKPGVVSARGS